MNISKKLYLNFGIILTMVLFLLAVNLSAVFREHETKAGAQRSLDMTEATSAVRFQMMQKRMHLQNYLLSGDTRDVEKMTEGARQLGDALHRAQELASSDQQRRTLETVQQLEQSWMNEFANPLAEKRRQVDSGNATVAELQIFYLQKDPNSWVTRSSESLEEVDSQNRKLLEERRRSDETATTYTIVAALVSTLIALIVGTLIAYRTSKGISMPLAQLNLVAKQIGESGNLDHTVDTRGKDEIGELARTFDSMVKYLKEMASVSEAIAGGNLAVEAEPRSTADTLGNAFARMVEGLRGLVRNVRDAASQVASASSQVAGASDESAKISLQTSSAIDEVTSTMHEMSVNVQNMVKSTQTQASSVSETSASIDQMVASIQRVADTAKVLLDISNRSREEVHSGIGTMDKATDGLNRINTTIRSSGEIIDALGTRADDIGKIIEVIDDLAEQTNLLALNAAIEAARAGEQGRGFAVVADEVRKLAERTTHATKEIAGMIESIQLETKSAVQAMEVGSRDVQVGVEKTSAAGAALEEMIKMSEQVGDMISQIATAAAQQSSATEQINANVAQISSLTAESSASADQTAKACTDLSELAFDLQKLAGRFTVDTSHESRRIHSREDRESEENSAAPARALAVAAGRHS